MGAAAQAAQSAAGFGGAELAALVTAVGGLVFGLLSHRQATRANDRATTLEAVRVDTDRDRLQLEQYQTLLDEVRQLRDQLRHRDEQLEALRNQLRVAEEQVQAARTETRQWRETVERMEREMARLINTERRPGGRRRLDPPEEYPT